MLYGVIDIVSQAFVVRAAVCTEIECSLMLSYNEAQGKGKSSGEYRAKVASMLRYNTITYIGIHPCGDAKTQVPTQPPS